MVDKKHKGCFNELRAVTWLLENGYEVCRNLSQHGPVDLVAIRNQEVILIDVKQAYPRKDGGIQECGKLTAQQKALGVIRLLVTEDDILWSHIDSPPEA
jgi:Holliday junction resolvase-like predicted endonuclease